MENIAAKAEFLKNGYTPKLSQIAPGTAPLWGKMNLQQMIEHMGDYVRIGSGKDPEPCITPEPYLEKSRAFLVSEKPFRENTPNSLMPDVPPPAKQADIATAISRLQTELDDLFTIFASEPGKLVSNPFFGDLDHDMSVQLLHKHAWHHLRQFGITDSGQ